MWDPDDAERSMVEIPQGKETRRHKMQFNDGDPVVGLIRDWLDRADDYARFSPELAKLAKSLVEDLVTMLRKLPEVRVDYDEVESLTGVPPKTLQNRKVPNVGSPSHGQFRLGDLPFRDGATSPARLIAAFDRLVEQRACRQEAECEERDADAVREIRRKRAVREYHRRRSEQN